MAIFHLCALPNFKLVKVVKDNHLWVVESKGSVSSSDRDEFGTISLNLGRAIVEVGVSKSIDWYVTTISGAEVEGFNSGNFGFQLVGIIVGVASDSEVTVELKDR